jgi:hypothetical protein
MGSDEWASVLGKQGRFDRFFRIGVFGGGRDLDIYGTIRVSVVERFMARSVYVAPRNSSRFETGSHPGS